MDNNLTSTIIEWLAKHSLPGVKQRDSAWLKARSRTIGGSSIATIQGQNSYSTIGDLLAERVGLKKQESNFYMHWGTLFESVIKKIVETDRETTILGSDAFIIGPNCTSYSPDGLGVTKTSSSSNCERIILFEFKCPYTRRLGPKIPDYYVPQIKMGLDLISIAHEGLYVEGVFRKCTIEQLGPTRGFSLDHTSYLQSKLPLAYGAIGFYILENEHMLNNHNKDIGKCTQPIFEMLLQLADNGSIFTKNYPISFTPRSSADISTRPKSQQSAIDYPAEHATYCKKNNLHNIGILPWKLLKIAYHPVEKQPGYIQKWIPSIRSLISVIESCENKNIAEKEHICNNYIANLE